MREPRFLEKEDGLLLRERLLPVVLDEGNDVPNHGNDVLDRGNDVPALGNEGKRRPLETEELLPEEPRLETAEEELLLVVQDDGNELKVEQLLARRWRILKCRRQCSCCVQPPAPEVGCGAPLLSRSSQPPRKRSLLGHRIVEIVR